MKKVYIFSQVFPPDTASVSQHLGDFVEELKKTKCKITVFTANRDYEKPDKKYKSYVNDNISVIRIAQIPYSKKKKLSRALSFIYFNISLFFAALKNVEKNSVLISLTTPPLLSVMVSIIARLKRSTQINWIMDLQPELSIATNTLKQGLMTDILLNMSLTSYRKSDMNILLDRYMKEYLESEKINPSKIKVCPVWSPIGEEFNSPRLDNPFRREHGFKEKFVVMYSGNHAVVHPLDTALQAAFALRNDDRFLFVFIGGGVRVQDVSDFKDIHRLKNIIQLPYQPREKIKYSLTSADAHLVILGESLVGFTHPNKVYGALNVGKPIVYIGPKESHITDLIKPIEGNIAVMHGESDKLVKGLKVLIAKSEDHQKQISSKHKLLAKSFSKDILASKLVSAVKTFL